MRKNCPLITAVTGFTILVIGIICAWYAFPLIIDNAINENIALKEGSLGWNTWKKQPFPIKFKIYFFNVQNPTEFQNGANPIVKEIGPYVYDEYREKTNITVNENNDTIRYVLKKTYFFNQKESGCRSEDDEVSILNAGLVGIALQVELLMPSALSLINDAIPYLYPGTKDVILRAKVKDILFEGLPIYCKDPEVEFVCGAMQAALPPTLRPVEGGKVFLFSMFNHLNGTEDGPYEIGRGLKNTTRGYLLSVQDRQILSNWGAYQCNMINGSDSTIFPRMKDPEERLYSYAQDFCRSLFASYVEDTTLWGIPVRKYVAKPESIQNTEENKCFCPQGKDEQGNDIFKCPINGLFEITPCLKAPILVSYPHFLMADPVLYKYVSGLKPDPKLHTSFAYIEPKTGTPISGAKRAQMNIHVKKFADFDLLNNVSEGIFPILWVEEGADIPEKYLDIIKDNFSKISMVDMFKWLLILSGLITMIVAFVMVMYREKLLCFTKVGNADVTVPKRNDQVHQRENLSEMQFNNTVIYPTLYPQVENKNVHDGLARRHQWNQGQAQAQPQAWSIKM